MKVMGKVIVVTGGGNGIGREVVLELLRRGAKVAAVDLRKESLDDTAVLARAGESLATFALDITDRDAVLALPEQVNTALGAPDGLINVAGIIQPFVKLVDLDFDVIERVIDVNLYGTLNTIKAFLPGLITRPIAHIVNVSSMGGFLPVPGQTIYGASKAAVKLMSEGLYAELLDTAVGVTCVMPGGVRTQITANSGVESPMSEEEIESSKMPVTEPDEAARQIIDAIEHDRLHLYIGIDSRLMNVASRLAPKPATHLITRQMKELLGA